MRKPERFVDGVADVSDPTDDRAVDFDWPELERALGEAEVGPAEYEQLAFALGRVMRWLVGHDADDGELSRVGIRVLKLCERLNPDLLANRPKLKRLVRSVRRAKRPIRDTPR